MSNNKVVDCRHGRMLVNPKDVYIGRALEKYGEYAEDEFDIFERIIEPDFVVVDCGANIGTHSLWLAQRVALVFSFEPQRLIFQMLCANMALNNVDNVFAYHAAVGERGGMIRVPCLDPDKELNFGALNMSHCTEGEPVRMMTVDGLGLARCDLIKMDVEGHEVQALAGARETIMRNRPYLYIEDDKEPQRESLHKAIRSLGYEFRPSYSMLYKPNNFNGDAENIFGRTANFNLICVPEEHCEAQEKDAAA